MDTGIDNDLKNEVIEYTEGICYQIYLSLMSRVAQINCLRFYGFNF